MNFADTVLASKAYEGATPPVNPFPAQAWRDTSKAIPELKLFDGLNWISITGGCSGTPQPPQPPTTGSGSGSGSGTGSGTVTVTGAYLPLAGGTMIQNSVVDWNNGEAHNLNIDHGRY